MVYAISEDINLPKGISILCLPEAGAYSVVLKACHIFDQLKYELIVPQKLPLVAKAEKSRISTKIITNDSTTKSDHFFLKVKTSVQEQTIKVPFNIYIFAYKSYWYNFFSSMEIFVLLDIIMYYILDIFLYYMNDTFPGIFIFKRWIWFCLPSTNLRFGNSLFNTDIRHLPL